MGGGGSAFLLAGCETILRELAPKLADQRNTVKDCFLTSVRPVCSLHHLLKMSEATVRQSRKADSPHEQKTVSVPDPVGHLIGSVLASEAGGKRITAFEGDRGKLPLLGMVPARLVRPRLAR